MWNVMRVGRNDCLLGCNVSHEEATFWLMYYTSKYAFMGYVFFLVPIPEYEEG